MVLARRRPQFRLFRFSSVGRRFRVMSAAPRSRDSAMTVSIRPAARISNRDPRCFAIAHVQIYCRSGSCGAVSPRRVPRRRVGARQTARWTRFVVVEPPRRPRGVLVFVHGLGGAADSPNTLWLCEAASRRGLALGRRWTCAGAGGPRGAAAAVHGRGPRRDRRGAIDHPAIAGGRGPRVAVGSRSAGASCSVGSACGGAARRSTPPSRSLRRRTCHRARRRSGARATASMTWSSPGRSAGGSGRSRPRSGRRPHGVRGTSRCDASTHDFAALACGQPRRRALLGPRLGAPSRLRHREAGARDRGRRRSVRADRAARRDFARSARGGLAGIPARHPTWRSSRG